MTSVQDLLGRLDDQSFEEYLRSLRRAEGRARRGGWQAQGFDADEAGHPLGAGFPSGAPLRRDGQSHRDGWMSVVRRDPCAYCGVPAAGTVDHIEPQRGRPCSGIGGVHTWLNFAAACESCNGRKGSEDMLMFLAARAGCRGASIRPQGAKWNAGNGARRAA